MASDALSQAWRYMLNDVYLRKAENEGEISEEEREVLEDFLALPFTRESVADFLDTHFPHDMAGFDHFMYNLRHYDINGDLAYKPKKAQQQQTRITEPVDFSDFLNIPPFEEWEAQQKKTRRRFPTREDARRAYERFKLKTIKEKSGAVRGFTRRDNVHRGGLGDYVEPVGDEKSMWELLTEAGDLSLPALRAITQHQTKLGRMLYDRMDNHPHSEVFAAACAALTTEQLIGSMTANTRESNRRLVQLNQLDSSSSVPHHYWQEQGDIASLDTDAIKDHLVRCYTRLFSDMMYQVRDAVFSSRRGKKDIREVLLGPEDDQQRLDEILKVPGLAQEINNRIDAYLMTDTHADEREREGKRYRDSRTKQQEEAVEGSLRDNLRAMKMGAERVFQAQPVTEDDKRQWFEKGERYAYGKAVRRIINEVAAKHIANACLNDVSLRAGMGFTDDFDGNPIPRSPMADWLDRQHTLATVGGDEKGGKDVISTTQFGDVSDIVSRLYDFVNSIRQGVAGEYYRDEEQKVQNRLDNWHGILDAWDRLNNRQKGIMMNMVSDPRGGARAMSPLIGTLLSKAATAPLPTDVNGEPRIDGKTYLEAFVDHILQSQKEIEGKPRGREEEDDNKLFTQSSREELLDYLSHDKVTTGDTSGGSGSKMPVWKDYYGKECEPVYVAGIASRKMEKDPITGVSIGPKGPDDTVDAVLAAHSLSKYGEDGMVTPLEVIYAHVYDRLMRQDRDPYVDDIESARLTKDQESIGNNYSLADWLDKGNWDSVTGTARAMGYYNLQGLPDVPTGLTARWKKARAALRPTDHTGRERTESDIMNSVGFKSKYGRYVADFDPTRDSPDAHRCPSCDGTGLKTLASGRRLRTPCQKCMTSVREVKEAFRSYSDLPESLLERWVGCQNPILQTKDIKINADSLKLIDQYRKDHDRDTETLYKAIRRTAHRMGVGIIDCPDCNGRDRNCTSCDGSGKAVDPMLFAKDVLGSFGDDNEFSQADIMKQGEIESAFGRMLRGIKSSEQDEIEAKMSKGVWPSQRGVPGHEYDRHLFSLLPVMHGDSGPLTIDNLERLFLEMQTQDEEEFKARLERELQNQAENALQSTGEHDAYLRKYDTRHFIESEHTQALLNALAERKGRDFPADRVSSLLKRVWHQDIDGHNTHLDDGRFSDGPCSQCNGQHCSQCNYTGREGIRMMISRSPALAKYPPQILQQVVAHRDLDRPLSVLESPIAQAPLGHHVCNTCNHGMASEIMRGNRHSAHILNPEAVAVNRLAASADNGVNIGTLSMLLTNMQKLQRFQEEFASGRRLEEYDEAIASDALNKVRQALSGEEERKILEEINKSTPLGAELDFGEMAELARDDEKFDVPPSISQYVDNVEHSKQKCPHCCQLHLEGIIPASQIRRVKEEEEYSRGLEAKGGEAGDMLSMGGTLCKNMVTAIQENKGGYGNMDLYDAMESMDDALVMLRRRESMSEESVRLHLGIDALQPITEHLTEENLGLTTGGYGRDIDIGEGTLVRLPDVRTPLAKTMLWARMNDPTKKSRLSQITGSNAIQRKESDMRHEHSLFTFLNTLENGQHFPQSAVQDKSLERLYAYYILNPGFGGKSMNILGYRDPNRINNEDSDAQKRVEWAKSVIGPIGKGEGKITKKAMKEELKNYFSSLAPLLRLEQRYKEFRHTPVGSVRRAGPATKEGEAPSVLPESLLDAKWRNDTPEAPFLDMSPESDLAQTMGLLRIHAVNLSEFANYGRLNEDQMGFLTPFEHHPSLEYLLNPNVSRTLDPTIIRAWINHEEDRLPEVMKTDGKSWGDILDGRFEDAALSKFSFPGLLWNYATGGTHEHEGEGGWPEVEDLVDDEGNQLVDAHLIHFYHYLAKEMKLRADNAEGSKRMMQKSLKSFPRLNMNEFGTGSRCLVCRGSNHGTLPLGLAMHLHPRLEHEMPNDQRQARPAVKGEDGRMEMLIPDEHGVYDFNDPNVRKYIVENLAPFGHEPGERSWRKVYDDHMKHGDVPEDSEGEPISFEKWLPLQSAECIACKGQCHCSGCDGHGHGEMNEAAKEASLNLFLSTAQALHNMVGIVNIDGHLEYHPEFAEVQPPPEDPMYEVFEHIINRQNELDMALRSLRGPDGDIIGLTGGLEHFRRMNTQDQIDLVEMFQDQLGHLVYGEASFDMVTKPDKKKDAKRRKIVEKGESPVDDDEESLDDHLDELERRERNSREFEGFFSDTSTWKESQKRRILGGFGDHVDLVQGPEYGEDLHLLDEDGNYLKNKDGDFVTLARFGYDATRLRMMGHEGPLTDSDVEEATAQGPLYGPDGKTPRKPASTVADINQNSASPLLGADGRAVIAQVKNEGKGYKKTIYNKMPKKLEKALYKFKEKKFKKLQKEKLEELGIEANMLPKPEREAITEAVFKLVKKEQNEDGSKKFWDKRKYSHYVPLLVSPDGTIHTLMDKQPWFKARDTMTDDELEADKKHRAHINRMRDKGFNDSIEGFDPRKSRFQSPGWDRDGLGNPIGTMKTNLHKTSSFVRGTIGSPANTGGTIAHGNRVGWHHLLLKQMFPWGHPDIDAIKAAADTHIKALSHEQYFTPYGGGGGGQHRHFLKLPEGEEDEETGVHVADAFSDHLAKKNFGGVEVGHSHTKGSHNVVRGRDLLTRRLQAMAGGSQATDSRTGVRLCPSCSGSQVQQGNLCPACHGHGYVPLENAEPIVRYDKVSAMPFHTKGGGVPIETDLATFKKALRRRLAEVKNFKEYPAKDTRIAMIEKKLETIMDPNFRIIIPHKGWGARVGHRPPKMIKYRNKETGETEFYFKPDTGLASGYGDGFIGLHSADAVKNFIKGINEIMSTPSEWENLYNRYKRLAAKHIDEWQEGEEGSVRVKDGKPRHVLLSGWSGPEDWSNETSDNLTEAIEDAKKAGDHKKKKGSKRRKEFEELKELRGLVDNMTAIKIGMFNAHQGDMAIRQDKDTAFGTKSFTESKEDSVHLVSQAHAKRLLAAMDRGVPFVNSLLPLGHGGDMSIARGGEGSTAKMSAYRAKVIGNRSIGMAPNDRIAELRNIVREGQKGILQHRMGYTPHQVSQILNLHGDPKTSKVNHGDIVDICTKLGIHASYVLPYQHEVEGKDPDELRQIYRSRYEDIRRMAEEAYENTHWAETPSAPESIYQYSQADTSRIPFDTPEDDNVQTSFDSPLDSAFFILKNII